MLRYFWFSFAFWGGAIIAQDASLDEFREITPANVHQHVAVARGEIELIRLEMGKPGVTPPPIEVEQAAPREVFFQALTLFRKADRLAFEHTRERVAEPVLPAGEIRPGDVIGVVDAALKRIGRVKERLGITEVTGPPPLQPEIDPSHVFKSIVAANREINQLLDRPFAPSEVYQQLTVAIAYAARILDSPGEISTPPQPPPFERRKKPADVYQKLLTCFNEIHEIGEKSGIPMLSLKVNESARIEQVGPSDVYDMASLLVSELAHLHGQKSDARPPRQVHNPGRKLPSHVYQRIGILCQQMRIMDAKAVENPNWLKD